MVDVSCEEIYKVLFDLILSLSSFKKFSDFSEWIKLGMRNRQIQRDKDRMISMHPWMQSIITIYRLLREKDKHKNSGQLFIQMIEGEPNMDDDDKAFFIHWVCTQFPQMFPIVWVGSDEKSYDFEYNTDDGKQILFKFPSNLNVQEFCVDCVSRISQRKNDGGNKFFYFCQDLSDLCTWKLTLNNGKRQFQFDITEKDLVAFLSSAPIYED